MPSIPLRNEPRASGDPMKTTVEYRGRIFDENSDLLAEVRDAVKGYGAPWLRSDLPQPWAVADWGQAFAGTALHERLADAALTVIETGNRDEAETASVLPYEDAPNAVARVVSVLEREPERFGSEPRAVATVIWKLASKNPHDARVLELLRNESSKPDADELIRETAARYLRP